MIYKESSIDIVEGFKNDMTFVVEIESVVNDGGGFHTLTVCDMFHAQPGFKVTIGVLVYTIKSIVPALHPSCGVQTKDSLVVKGDAANIVATTFNMYVPFFFHGTPISQGVELAKIKQAKNKTPMLWFHEEFKDRFFEDPTQNTDREIQFRLFFLTEAIPSKWVTAEAYDNAVKPMRRLAEHFVAQLKTKLFRVDTDTLEYEIINYAKFGVFISNRGQDKKLWHDNLSGCEINFSNLTVFKRDGKEACEDC